MPKLTKEEFYAKLATLPTDEATPEEKVVFKKAAAERAAGTYEGTPLEEVTGKQGRTTLRLPSSLYKELQAQAKYEQMSLKQYMVYALGRFAEAWKARHNN